MDSFFLFWLLFYHGNIRSFFFLNLSFLSSFTQSAYLSVFKVYSLLASPGDMFPIITVQQLPIKESLRTIVSFEPQKGICFLSWSKHHIHSLRAKSDLLISAPSIQVYWVWPKVSAPLSLPARSIKLSKPVEILSDKISN